eukprot:1316780-Pyramimonas_sp.AAC.2
MDDARGVGARRPTGRRHLRGCGVLGVVRQVERLGSLVRAAVRACGFWTHRPLRRLAQSHLLNDSIQPETFNKRSAASVQPSPVRLCPRVTQVIVYSTLLAAQFAV